MNIERDTVCVMEVIVCTKKRRGNGKDDPIRIITEVFTKEGELIAEHDPFLQHPDKENALVNYL